MSRRKERSQKWLDRWQALYETLKRSVGEFGYVFPGSVVKRYMPCGKPNCRCAMSSRHHHGPYYEWSRKLRGKTVTLRLSAEQAQLYRQWAQNNRQLRNIIAKMRSLSARVAEAQLKAATRR